MQANLLRIAEVVLGSRLASGLNFRFENGYENFLGHLYEYQQTEMPAGPMSLREYRGVHTGSWRAATCVPWACSHGTPKRGTERELSGLERSEHKRKTIRFYAHCELPLAKGARAWEPKVP